MSAAEQLPLVPGLETAPKARRARPPAKVLVLAALKSNAVPMLVEAIAKATHLPPSSVAARVGELVRENLVLPAVVQATRTGRRAWAFALLEHIAPSEVPHAVEYRRAFIASRGRWLPLQVSSGRGERRAEILGT